MSFVSVKYFNSFDYLGSFESLDLFPYLTFLSLVRCWGLSCNGYFESFETS